MRCPTPKSLDAAFRDLSLENARLIVKLAHSVDNPDTLKELAHTLPRTTHYLGSLYSDPFDSAMWRRTVMLYAIDEILETHGVESIGPLSSSEGPPYEYCNAGDPYSTTIIYSRDKDSLTIGCWGDIVEREDPDGEW